MQVSDYNLIKIQKKFILDSRAVLKGTPFKLSFIAYLKSNFFTTNEIDNELKSCGMKQISKNVFSILPIEGLNNLPNLVSLLYEEQPVINLKYLFF